MNSQKLKHIFLTFTAVFVASSGANAEFYENGEWNNFIGIPKLMIEDNTEKFAVVGPKGEIIIEPTANSYVLDEFISCIKQAHKQKGLVYITAKTETTDNETYVITDLRNAGCELNYNRNSFPSISYKAHCPIVNLGEKSITGTYNGIDVGDYVHFDFTPDNGETLDILADEEKVEHDLGSQSGFKINLKYKEEINWDSSMSEDFDESHLGMCGAHNLYVSASRIKPDNNQHQNQNEAVDTSNLCSQIQSIKEKSNVYDPRTGRNSSYFNVYLLSRFDHPFLIQDFIINRNPKLKLNQSRGPILVKFGQRVLLSSRINARSEPIELTIWTDNGAQCTLAWK